MERTEVNYDFIRERHSCGADVFEVTQLLNSFLGAFAYPWEDWKKELLNTPLDKAHADGWPRVERSDP
jgi:hypothetical protein